MTDTGTTDTGTTDTGMTDAGMTDGSPASLRIKDRLGVTAELKASAAGSLARSEGKAKRVFDHRR